MRFFTLSHRVLLQALSILATSALVACQPLLDPTWDKETRRSQEEYRAILDPVIPETSETDVLPPQLPPIPLDVSSEWPASQSSPALQHPVSIRTTERMPIQNILMDLGEQAGLDLDIDPKIQGRAILSVREQPLAKVLDLLAERAGLRWRLDGTLLVIQEDTPYVARYAVPALSLTRKGQTHIATATNIFNVADGKVGTYGNGSDVAIDTASESNFWTEIEQNLKTFLGEKPVEDGETASKETPRSATFWTLNKQAGVITVRTTARQQKVIREYLQKVVELMSAQIIIEAKVMEVSLDDAHQSGVNWKTKKGDFTFTLPFENAGTGTIQGALLGGSGKAFEGILSFMEGFGTVRMLSNPRLTVMNNQLSVIKVAENHVYFKLEYKRSRITSTTAPLDDVVQTSSRMHTVPIGLIMLVQPSIDLNTNEITLALRPTISRIKGVVRDPAVEIASDEKVHSEIPIVAVQEMDSVLKMHSGQVVVLGGLMQERDENKSAGLPGTGQVPGVSLLFGQRERKREVVELVIFLKATIVRPTAQTPPPLVAPADTRLYDTYAKDPRPLTFKPTGEKI